MDSNSKQVNFVFLLYFVLIYLVSFLYKVYISENNFTFYDYVLHIYFILSIILLLFYFPLQKKVLRIAVIFLHFAFVLLFSAIIILIYLEFSILFANEIISYKSNIKTSGFTTSIYTEISIDTLMYSIKSGCLILFVILLSAIFFYFYKPLNVFDFKKIVKTSFNLLNILNLPFTFVYSFIPLFFGVFLESVEDDIMGLFILLILVQSTIHYQIYTLFEKNVDNSFTKLIHQLKKIWIYYRVKASKNDREH
jgi:hypothetical protein